MASILASSLSNANTHSFDCTEVQLFTSSATVMKVRAFAFLSLFLVVVFLGWQLTFFGHISSEKALNHINNVYDKIFSKGDKQPATNPDLAEPIKETVVEDEPWAEPSPSPVEVKVEETPKEATKDKVEEIHKPWPSEESLPTPVQEIAVQTIEVESTTPAASSAASSAAETPMPIPVNTETPIPVNEINTLSPESVRIYIGIVTAWWNFGSRLLLRETYTHFKIPGTDSVTIRFVLGQPPPEDLGIIQFLEWEQERYKDIQLLNMTENMNDGKSYEYFAELGRMFPSNDPSDRPWDYAMKADDDTLINIPQLLERLRPQSTRKDLYMGRGTDTWHMGAGYILSWDVVTWLRDNRNEDYMRWDEDQAIGAMLRVGGKGANFINLQEQVMDHPSKVGTGWDREYGPDVILVHQLKTLHLMGDAIQYFLGHKRHESLGKRDSDEFPSFYYYY